MNYQIVYYETVDAVSTILEIIEEHGWLQTEVLAVYSGLHHSLLEAENVIISYDIIHMSVYKAVYQQMFGQLQYSLLLCERHNTLLPMQFLENRIRKYVDTICCNLDRCDLEPIKSEAEGGL